MAGTLLVQRFNAVFQSTHFLSFCFTRYSGDKDTLADPLFWPGLDQGDADLLSGTVKGAWWSFGDY